MSKHLVEKQNVFFDLIKKNKEIIIPTVTLFAICLIVTLALSLSNMFTKDRIASLGEKAKENSMKRLIAGEKYKKSTINFKKTEAEYYTVLKGKDVLGYIFTTSKKGYGGEIKVMTAVDTENKIIGVDILEADDETAGLGQNVTKEAFKKQYNDKTNGISVVKNGAKENEINAVTGATISSKAVTNAVNEALEMAEAVINESEVEADEK